MKHLSIFIIVVISLFTFSCSKKSNDESDGKKVSLIHPSEKHFTHVTQLTDGGENAEAYLSFDQKKLIFQSTTGNMECDQIFIMNIDGSDKHRVSTGMGRTTCSYFMKGDKRILYASTHHYGAPCPAKPDMSKGYVWKLYDTFDIFTANPDGSDLKQLTDTHKYDAEATLSPDGNKIVFTSTRDGDPEIYTMNPDGSDQKRLTFAKGYDGGPFFSPDGKKIVFRASRPRSEAELKDYRDLVENGLVRPSKLEIYVMNADGTNIEQITDLGSASFAPYFHPDGKRIIFSSNYGSKKGRQFDLYMVNISDKKIDRLTYSKGFDGFPIFTKDGKKLIFASNRNNEKKGDTNIFIADWTE